MGKGFSVDQFDLVADAEEGAECVLHNPVTWEPTDAAITVLGRHAKAYRAARREMVDVLTKRGRRGQVPEEERDLATAKAMADVTLGWRGIMLDGKELPFSKENAVKLYTHPRCVWVIEQLEAFQASSENFTQT